MITIIKLLNELEKEWNNSLMLFAGMGGLLLVDVKTREVLASFEISCDGGDPGTVIIGEKEYLGD